MFEHIGAGDWIALLALAVTVLSACIGTLWLVARRLGNWESDITAMKSKMDDMATDIESLDDRVSELGRVDVAVQLLSQSMGNLGAVFHEFREESREARRETRLAIEGLRQEIKQEVGEIRHDVRNLMTGKVQPPRRPPARS